MPARTLFPLLLVLAGCSTSSQREEVVARVGESYLTLVELDGQVPGDDPGSGRRRFVEDWVRDQLLYQEAVERGVAERPRVRRLVEQARQDVIVAAFLDGKFQNRTIEVSPGDVQDYYDRNAAEFTREEDEIRAQHILLGSRGDAESLRKRLLRGGGFETRVAEFSLDLETASSGGDLGYFGARELPELWEACADIEQGQLSEVVATHRGYHIVRLRDRREAGSLRSLDEAGVRRRIEEALVGERHRGRLDSLLDRLREDHDWRIDEALLRVP